MDRCSNCGKETKHLFGNLVDLCNECYENFGYVLDPQNSTELKEDTDADNIPMR